MVFLSQLKIQSYEQGSSSPKPGTPWDLRKSKCISDNNCNKSAVPQSRPNTRGFAP